MTRVCQRGGESSATWTRQAMKGITPALSLSPLGLEVSIWAYVCIAAHKALQGLSLVISVQYKTGQTENIFVCYTELLLEALPSRDLVGFYK